ncbi:MAG: DUF2281 domain-containing protein [Bacteroidetes bacterium]|nr:DUF2281 domain-containing protein [Bacteroidota bacterium]MBU1678238.1 DUF2281 domain-containing protein [Bacteroidota bacterium]MBU2506925.1 DUF2281 domain-containing protein [Bacteroidota bacterium]
MESKGFYNKFESLPIEAQRQVLAFIDLLQKRYRSKSKKPSERKSIINKKFVGLWENRVDLKDSSLWIRNLRRKEWEKIGE